MDSTTTTRQPESLTARSSRLSTLASAITVSFVLMLSACSSDGEPVSDTSVDSAVDDSALDSTDVDGDAGVDAGADADTPEATPPLASTEGFVLFDVQLTDEIDPTTGAPGADLESIDVGTPARIWLSFDDADAVPGKDTLFVAFYRDGVDAELFRTAFRLPQPIGQQNVALGSADTTEAGAYRAEISFNDEVLHIQKFDVV